MKAVKLILKIFLFIAVVVVVWLIISSVINAFRIHSIKKHISQSNEAYVIIDDTRTRVSDADYKALREIFSQADFKPSSGCISGYFEDYSIELCSSESGEKIRICPVVDKCSFFRINYTIYAVEEKTRTDFDDIVKKYGLTFPHI